MTCPPDRSCSKRIGMVILLSKLAKQFTASKGRYEARSCAYRTHATVGTCAAMSSPGGSYDMELERGRCSVGRGYRRTAFDRCMTPMRVARNPGRRKEVLHRTR